MMNTNNLDKIEQDLAQLSEEIKEMNHDMMRNNLDKYKLNLFDDLLAAFGDEMTNDIYEVIEYRQTYKSKYGTNPIDLVQGILNEIKVERNTK